MIYVPPNRNLRVNIAPVVDTIFDFPTSFIINVSNYKAEQNYK